MSLNVKNASKIRRRLFINVDTCACARNVMNKINKEMEISWFAQSAKRYQAFL